jgi:DNA mismatch endonuclease (patch repair protein)
MNRSDMMRAVRRKSTEPEMIVRRTLHALGFRYALHRKDLPGTPDIVLTRHATVIFVNGCFWHHHGGCSKASVPKTNSDYWISKFTRNKARDVRNQSDLESMGWHVIVVWGCETRDTSSLARKLKRELTKPKRSSP